MRTNLPADQLGSEETVRTYKRLARVERAFRSLKSVDLKVRLIYHRLADRVRAHFFLCMLAYYVEWHMRRRLAPLLFDYEDPAAGEKRRSSVVAKAQRSAAAENKARKKRTEDGWPVHSFQDLLDQLATLCLNRVRPDIPKAIPFDQYTAATPLQHRAFDLLGVSTKV